MDLKFRVRCEETKRKYLMLRIEFQNEDFFYINIGLEGSEISAFIVLKVCRIAESRINPTATEKRIN